MIRATGLGWLGLLSLLFGLCRPVAAEAAKLNVEAELALMVGKADDYDPSPLLNASDGEFRALLRALLPNPDEVKETIQIDDVHKWYGQLSHDIFPLREEAMHRLVDLGPDARAVMERFMQPAMDHDLHVRLEIIEGSWRAAELNVRSSGLARYYRAMEIVLFKLRDPGKNHVLAEEIGRALRCPRIQIFERRFFKACIQHLVRRREPALLTPIGRVLPTAAESSVLDVLDWIGGVSRGNEFAPPLLDALSDPRERVRRLSLKQVPNRPTPEVAKRLRVRCQELMTQPASKGEQLEAAVVAWSVLGERKALPILAGVLDRLDVLEPSLKALEAVAEGPELSPAPAELFLGIQRALDHERQTDLRRQGFKALKKLKGESASRLLRKLVNDPDEFIAKATGRLLRR